MPLGILFNACDAMGTAGDGMSNENEKKSTAMIDDAVLLKKSEYEVSKAVLDAMSSTVESILLYEFEAFIKNNRFMEASKSKFMPYLSALAVLSLTFRDVSNDNLSALMGSADLDFDEKVFDTVPKTYLDNRLVYVHAFYFLVINGKETTEENIRKVVAALNIRYDKKAYGEALKFICTYTKCGGHGEAAVRSFCTGFRSLPRRPPFSLSHLFLSLKSGIAPDTRPQKSLEWFSSLMCASSWMMT